MPHFRFKKAQDRNMLLYFFVNLNEMTRPVSRCFTVRQSNSSMFNVSNQHYSFHAKQKEHLYTPRKYTNYVEFNSAKFNQSGVKNLGEQHIHIIHQTNFHDLFWNQFADVTLTTLL